MASQLLLGHSTPNQTLAYMRLAGDCWAELVNRFAVSAFGKSDKP